jgi:hypothetical protein
MTVQEKNKSIVLEAFDTLYNTLGCDPRRSHTRAIKEWSAHVRPHVRDLCECPIKNRYVVLS